ncbi:hypothetical protein [Legionella israelensis]|nr:hypothetical protein [Legionella israelensis]
MIYSREDYPKRDDQNWLKQLLCYSSGQYEACNSRLVYADGKGVLY